MAFCIAADKFKLEASFERYFFEFKKVVKFEQQPIDNKLSSNMIQLLIRLNEFDIGTTKIFAGEVNAYYL